MVCAAVRVPYGTPLSFSQTNTAPAESPTTWTKPVSAYIVSSQLNARSVYG